LGKKNKRKKKNVTIPNVCIILNNQNLHYYALPTFHSPNFPHIPWEYTKKQAAITKTIYAA
jgi:hypothetical protein